MTSKEMTDLIVKALDSKKGIDIEVIDVSEKTILADYFVIASGNSTTQIKALSDEVEFVLKNEAGIYPDHVEGRSGGESKLRSREALGDKEQSLIRRILFDATCTERPGTLYTTSIDAEDS